MTSKQRHNADDVLDVISNGSVDVEALRDKWYSLTTKEQMFVLVIMAINSDKRVRKLEDGSKRLWVISLVALAIATFSVLNFVGAGIGEAIIGAVVSAMLGAVMRYVAT